MPLTPFETPYIDGRASPSQAADTSSAFDSFWFCPLEMQDLFLLGSLKNLIVKCMTLSSTSQQSDTTSFWSTKIEGIYQISPSLGIGLGPRIGSSFSSITSGPGAALYFEYW